MTQPIFDVFMDPRAGTGNPDDIFEQRDNEVADGSTAAAADGSVNRRDTAASDEPAPIPGGGPLLEEPSDAKVFRTVDKEVRRQDRLMRNRDEEGKHWDSIRSGVQFSILEKSEDAAVYRRILPPGVEDVQQPVPNKVLDLSNKQVSQILVDPPLPNPKPDADGDRSRGAMDLARQFLRNDGDASGTNDAELWREVLTMNRTRKSAFVFVWVDPVAGGWRPKQKKAHPQAADPRDPLVGPVLDANGQPQLGEDGQPLTERTTDPVLRYVAEEPDPETGETVERFTEHAAEAAREWLPKHRRKLLHPNQVLTIPQTATAFDAREIIAIMWEPLGEARRRFPVLDTLAPAELRQLCEWRPKRWKALVPEALRPKGDGIGEDGELSDDALLFWYHKFCRISPDYQDGGEIAVTGGTLRRTNAPGFVLKRDTLREDIEGDDGTLVPVLMDPPIAQFRALIDADRGDPQGLAPVSQYGGANEIRAHLYLATLEDIDARLHANTYLTATSNLTREDINRRDGTPLEVLTKDDMPTFEQRPPLPATVPQMLERIEHDMDVSANLSQTAQALDSAYSQSGVAKQVSINQAKVQLAQDWQGFISGATQYWKIKLQLAQARLKTPQLVKVAGENAAYKARHFVGADLLGVSTVALMPGTGTMMNPAEKAQYLTQFQQSGWLEPEQSGELARSSMSDDLGLPPNPHEEYIDRCIAEWIEGPPKGWLDQFAQNQSLPQRQQQHEQQAQALTAPIVQSLTAQGMDPQTAQQTAEQQVAQRLGPPPQPVQLYTPFDPRPNDEEPVVAKIHYSKLSRLMSTVEYDRQPKPWRSLVDDKYKRSAHAAGVQTVAEQEAAQQQAAQAQAAGQKDPNAPPTYEQFVAAATKSVISRAQQLLASEVAAVAASTSVAQKPAAQPVPEQLDQQNQAADQAHQSAEAERDRQHEMSMATLEHAHALEQMATKAALTPPKPQPAAPAGSTA